MLADESKDSKGELEELEKLMKELFYRSDCPNNQLLNAYLWELVSDDERLQVEAHLAHCPHCPQDVEALRMKPVEQTEPELEKSGILDRLVFFPRFIQTAGQAVRSAVRGPSSINHTYHVEELDWDIVLTGQVAAGQLFALQGQLLGDIEDEWGMIEINLIQTLENDQKSVGMSQIGADGIFAFNQLQAGDYAILIKTSAGEIPIPDIVLEL